MSKKQIEREKRIKKNNDKLKEYVKMVEGYRKKGDTGTMKHKLSSLNQQIAILKAHITETKEGMEKAEENFKLMQEQEANKLQDLIDSCDNLKRMHNIINVKGFKKKAQFTKEG